MRAMRVMRLLHVKRMFIVAIAGAIACAIATLDTASAVPRRAVSKPRTVSITIAAMAFAPPEIAVKVGDTVEWLNKDVVGHTATEKKVAVWDVTLAPGETRKAVMNRAGRFDYYCRYHPNMKATLVVQRAAK